MPRSYRFDDVLVDPPGFRALKSGKPLPLEPKALSVLIFLIENRGRLVDKRELLDSVWNDTFVTENVLSRAVAQLRKGLADDAKESRYIETVPTRGYRFIAHVEGEAEADSGGQAALWVKGQTDGSAASSFARTPVPWGKTWSRPYVVLFAVAGAAILIVIAIVAIRWRSGPKYLQIAQSTQITTSGGLSIYPTFSPDGIAMAYCADSGRGYEIFVRQLEPGGREVQITADGGQNIQPAWSPDGRLIAYASRDRGGIWLVSALGGTSRRLTEFGSHPAWSRDGQRIAFQSGPPNDLGADSSAVFPPSTIWEIRPDGKDARQLTRPGIPKGGHGAPSWSPDGKHIVFVSAGWGTGEVWSTGRDNTAPVRLASTTLGYYDPVYSLDGQSVLYGAVAKGANYGLWQVRVSRDSSAPLGEPVQITNSGGIRIKNLAISSDGKKLLYSAVSLTGSLQSLRVSPAGEVVGDPIALTSDAGCRALQPSFSPDGSQITFASCRGRPGVDAQIWLVNRDGTGMQQLTFGPKSCAVPRWFPDGRRVLYCAGSITDTQKIVGLFLVDTQTRAENLVTEIHQDVGHSSLSPDGTQLAFNSATGGIINVWLMDIASGRTRQLTFDKELLGFPSWSPDGRFIAAEMQRGGDTNVVILPGSGGPVTQLTFDHAQNWPYSWSLDGDRVMFAKREANGSWNVWSVSRSTKKEKQLTHYTKLNAYVRYPAVSPRSDQIVYEYTESTGNIWMLEFK